MATTPLVPDAWLRCPRCRYSLKGITSAKGRCPECGYSFTHDELLALADDPALRMGWRRFPWIMRELLVVGMILLAATIAIAVMPWLFGVVIYWLSR